jgi:hypothetical protein
MFKDYWKYEWVLPVYQYEGLEPLLAALAEKVIAPAETKVNALAERSLVNIIRQSPRISDSKGSCIFLGLGITS